MKCIIIILALISLAGCSSVEYIVNIAGEKISVEEYNIYLYEQRKLFEERVGSDIWDMTFDGSPAEHVARQNAMESLIHVKISVLQARKLGIYLTYEDSLRAIEEAHILMEEMYHYFGYSRFPERTVITVMEDMILFDRLYEYITYGVENGSDVFEEHHLKWRANTYVNINESVFYAEANSGYN